MFEHPIHHQDMRGWERTLQYSVTESTQSRISGSIQQKMDDILAQTAAPFDDGHDHFAYLHRDVDLDLVVKILKPNAREISVFGQGVSPEEAMNMELHTVSRASRLRPIHTIVDWMRQAHNVITEGIPEYKFIPTAIIPYNGHIFRVQRYAPRPEQGHDRLLLPLTYQFYEKITASWVRMTGSWEFSQLPDPVQKYYRYFGLDNGALSNAIFRGFIGTHPDFVIIDY